MGMECLNCHEEMINNLVVTSDDQISYDVCDSCGSLWLDAGELDKMAARVAGSVEFSSREPAEGVAEPARYCPRCAGVELDKVEFLGLSGILLDRCPNCGGFWLDGGELESIDAELREIMPVEGHGFGVFLRNVHLPYVRRHARRRSSEFDFEVEVPPIKGAERVAQTELSCPACASHLARYRAFGVGFEGCPRCRGVWLDRDELRALKDKATEEPWTDLRWMDDEVEALEGASAMPAGADCPRCDEPLVSAAFGGSDVLLDLCPSCKGVWLDYGELRALQEHLRRKLAETTPEEMRHNVYEEIKEIWSGPEDLLSEILDAKAAIAALVNMTITEHPRLADLLAAFGRASGSIGM
jgi:Zn-finger nucleic acid-binding protein